MLTNPKINDRVVVAPGFVPGARCIPDDVGAAIAGKVGVVVELLDEDGYLGVSVLFPGQSAPWSFDYSDLEPAPTEPRPCPECAALRASLEEAERRLRFWSKPGDPNQGWCGEHPRRVEADTAGMVGRDTTDGADLCLACEVMRLERELGREVENRRRVHADLDRAGIEPAAGQPCPDSTCESHLQHRVRDLIGERDAALARATEAERERERLRSELHGIRFELLSFTPDDDPDATTRALARLARKDQVEHGVALRRLEKAERERDALRAAAANREHYLHAYVRLTRGRYDAGIGSASDVDDAVRRWHDAGCPVEREVSSADLDAALARAEEAEARAARLEAVLAAERGERGLEGWEWIVGDDVRLDRWRNADRDLTATRGLTAGWVMWRGSGGKVSAHDYALEAMEAADAAGALAPDQEEVPHA